MNNFPIQHGLNKILVDHRNYSFPRTFGAIAPELLPLEDFDFDPGLTMPDQNADGNPEGCVWYTSTELCNDEDAAAYDVSFTRKNVLFMENRADGPCSLTDGLEATIDYGVRKIEESDTAAWARHRGQYFQVEETQQLDWFDSIRSTLWLNRANKRSVSIGTIWPSEFEQMVTRDGIIPGEFAFNGDVDSYPGHNWKISGQKTIDGTLYLKAKTWQGIGYGNGGWCYFPRTTINKLLSIQYSGAFTLAQATQENIQLVELTILERVYSYYYRLAGLLGIKLTV